MEEGFLVRYKNLLSSSDRPVNILYSFYLEFFQLAGDISILKALNRLVSLFGRDIVFKAIVSLESMDNINHTNIYPLLRFMCNKLMEPVEASKPVSLSEYKNNMEKLAEKAKKAKHKVRSPFDD